MSATLPEVTGAVYWDVEHRNGRPPTRYWRIELDGKMTVEVRIRTLMSQAKMRLLLADKSLYQLH